MEESWILQAAAVMGVAMAPVLELRGAIPFGLALGLPPAEVFLLAVVGNLVPVPAIILFARHVLRWLRRWPWWGRKIGWLEARAHLKGRVVKRYRLLGLCVLVAIPLPGTGAWTGALVATVFRIPMRQALPAILLGVVIAGGITLAVACGAITLWTM